ncbi:hypothetical protein AUTU_44820 (plasmid) [Aureibacter tunicatorum]|nr:hypothetical protein AUTU_44820 [Aureibacter tunicatorum]
MLAWHKMNAQIPPNRSILTAEIVNSFPYADSTVNTSLGGQNYNVYGCPTQCCSTAVYRIELSTFGSLRGTISNFDPYRAGSLLAYLPANEYPTSDNQLYFLSDQGNSCNYRDTLQLGKGYSWNEERWLNDDINETISPGVYYVLVFNYYNLFDFGSTNTDVTFDFKPYCPDGYECATIEVEICDGSDYISSTGDIYTISGNYIDTVYTQGAQDSLIFTRFKNNHKAYSENLYIDQTYCIGLDTMQNHAVTHRVSFTEFSPKSKDNLKLDTLTGMIENSDFSISTWVQILNQDSLNHSSIASFSSSNGNLISTLGVNKNKNLIVANSSETQNTLKYLADSTWHLVGYTYEASTGINQVFLDGDLIHTFTNPLTINTSSLMTLGAEYGSGMSMNNFFDGKITEVSVWNKILNSADFSSLMQTALDPELNPHKNYLVAYYPMIVNCRADDTILEDYSGNNHKTQASRHLMQKIDELETINGFNSAEHYEIAWKQDGQVFSTLDTIEITDFKEGVYELELKRDYFSISNTWQVYNDSICVCDSTVQIDAITACDSLEWSNGKKYFANASGITDTLTNIYGCDSVVMLDLKINNSSFSTDIQKVCDSLTWIDGNTYSSSASGIYHTLTNSYGCDSIVELNLTIHNLEAMAKADGQTLTAYPADANYQWLDCEENYAVIANANAQIFNTQNEGSYAAVVEKNGCADTTNCVKITKVGIVENSFGESITIYPNPTNGIINIIFSNPQNIVKVSISDANGKIIFKEKYENRQKLNFDFDGPEGTYFLNIKSKNKRASAKIIKINFIE